MFAGFETGDITAPRNRRDIVIGMNASLMDVTGIGRPFVANLGIHVPLDLGSVLSFRYDDERDLHMLICHHIGVEWTHADRYVRFGLDSLWYSTHTKGKDREYSIVDIGTGRIGLSAGADTMAIRSAIALSFLPVTLFTLPPSKVEVLAERAAKRPPLHAYRVISPSRGEERLAA